MNPIKTGARILILTAGLTGGYLIIKNSKPAGSGGYVHIESGGEAVENFQKSPIQWVEKAKEFISHPIESLGLGAQTDGDNPADGASFNLTEFVAKSVSSQMQTLDQQGVENIDPNDPRNQEAIEKAMAELQNFSLFDESISDKDLKISQDNSLPAKAKYIESVGKTFTENVTDVYKNQSKALDKLTSTGDVSDVKKLADTYRNIFNGVLTVSVPSDWLDLHERFLMILKKFEFVYRGIVDFKTDPIKADLLAQMIPELSEIELQIFKEYKNKLSEIGI